MSTDTSPEAPGVPQDESPDFGVSIPLPDPADFARANLDGPTFMAGGKTWTLPWVIFHPRFDEFRDLFYRVRLNPKLYKLEPIIEAAWYLLRIGYKLEDDVIKEILTQSNKPELVAAVMAALMGPNDKELRTYGAYVRCGLLANGIDLKMLEKFPHDVQTLLAYLKEQGKLLPIEQWHPYAQYMAKRNELLNF